MHKLTISKLELIQNQNFQLINETELGEIVGSVRLIQDLMSNVYFTRCWLEIGATHWELVEVFAKPIVKDVTESYIINSTYYHTGE